MDAKEIGLDALIEAFEYLDGLRASGRTNMFGAASFVQDEICWPRNEARAATALWMQSYDGDVPAAGRATKVFNEAA